MDQDEPASGARNRRALKHVLARGSWHRPTRGATLLTYHRVGGGSPDELDVTAGQFRRQMDVLTDHDVVPIDEALDRLGSGDRRPTVVLTFDDGWADVWDNAWPVLRDRRLPFTLYLATAYIGGRMEWPGSTARGTGPGLTWRQIEAMAGSGLCTLGNHTHTHVPAPLLSAEELDACSAAVESATGIRPRHFAYPWGVAVPEMEAALTQRFRSAATGEVGRNDMDRPPMRLARVAVRGSDPLPFFRAKLHGRLGPERAYEGVVSAVKAARSRVSGAAAPAPPVVPARSSDTPGVTGVAETAETVEPGRTA